MTKKEQRGKLTSSKYTCVCVAVLCRYSAVHFDRVTAFELCITELPLSQGWGSYTLCRYSCIYEARMNPALNGSSAIRCFECSDAIKICDGTILDFYTGLYYMYICMCIVHVYLDAQSTLSCFTMKALVTC